ncbi:MAG: hypothetical protein ACOC1K_00920 [Nanoarchaeota archaeon]
MIDIINKLKMIDKKIDYFRDKCPFILTDENLSILENLIKEKYKLIQLKNEKSI